MLQQFNMCKEDMKFMERLKAKSYPKDNEFKKEVRRNFSLPCNEQEWNEIMNSADIEPENIKIEQIISPNFNNHNNFIVFKIDEESAKRMRSYICATPKFNPLNIKDEAHKQAKDDLAEIYDKNYGLLILSDALKSKLKKFPGLIEEAK